MTTHSSDTMQAGQDPDGNLISRPSPPGLPARARIAFGLCAIGLGVGIYAYRLYGRADPSLPAEPASVIQRGAAAGYNILLVTFDTTRPEYLGCYGGDPSCSPHVDALAEHGIRFDDAVVSVPLTGPSHATILTGLSPPRHGMRTNGLFALPADRTTLAEILRNKDYASAAFVSTFVLDRRFGLDQGFATYDFQVTEEGRSGPESVFNERDAKHVTDAALAWLRGLPPGAEGKPFFAWVHYYDPHHPYRSPLARKRAWASRPYDAEIAFADQQLGRLLSALDEMRLRERTLIVFATDHGESFDDHGEDHHGIFIYEATMRAGLILSCPSLFDRAYRVDDRLVGVVDVMPTVLDLLGEPIPLNLDGVSLLTSKDPGRAIYIESEYPKIGLGCAPLYGLRTHTSKYILAPTAEFYDLRDDPRELENIFEQRPEGLDALQEKLAALMSAAPDDFVSAARPMTAEESSRLASLGYVGGAAAVNDAGFLPDPKDQIVYINQMSSIVKLAHAGETVEAMKQAREIAARCKGYETPIHVIASIYEAADRHAEAAELLETYSHTHPSANVLIHLAKTLLALRRWEDFDRALRDAERVEPGRGSIFILRGDRFRAQGRDEEALRYYERAFEIDGLRMGDAEQRKLDACRAAVDLAKQ